MQEIIRLDNVTAGYDGHAQIRNITLNVCRHDFLGIVGPNGGGKTTLLRVILGLLKPMEGTVAYFRDGAPAESLSMGYLPQYNAIDKEFPISVRDTVLSGLNIQKRLLQRFTDKQYRQADYIMRQTGIDNLAERPIKALSGGQLQRVLMARALVAEPEVIVLDEPNTYADNDFMQQMHGIINTASRRHTVIMVSHDTEYIHNNASKIISLDERIRS